jgi:hypothetical protein
MMCKKPQDTITNLLNGREIPLLPKEWKGLEKGKLYTFSCYTGRFTPIEISHPDLEKDVDKR